MTKNTLITLYSNVFPALLGLYCMRIVVSDLHVNELGFFMLTWAALGFVTMLDCGFGKALTHYRARDDNLARVHAAYALIVLTAVIVTVMAYIALYVYSLLNKQDSNLQGVGVAILMVPASILTAPYRALLEGEKKFKAAAMLRTWSSIVLIVVPTYIAIKTNEVIWIAGGFAFARFVVLFLHIRTERKYCNVLSLRNIFGNSVEDLKSVVGYSSWVGGSTVLGGLIGYLDRIVLSLFGPISVANLYTVPYEIVSRALIIPGAVSTISFSEISSGLSDRAAVINHFIVSYLLCTILFGLPLLMVFLWPEFFLNILLGLEEGNQYGGLLRILAVAIFINGMGQVPLTIIQAMGAPSIVTKIHLFELFPVLVLYFYLFTYFGVQGLAFGFLVRSAFDTLFLAYGAKKLVLQMP